jgi:formiminoglutamase
VSADVPTVRRGSAPLIVSVPHAGTLLPPEVEARVLSRERALKDTDWRVDALYADAAAEFDATFVATPVSRTAADCNRDPSGASLYPGKPVTGLCPTETFDGEPLYPPGGEPDEAEVARRRALYFDPYHAALAAEIARLRALHGRVVVYDCHSIRSEIPRLFPGTLPVFSIGTNGGAAADRGLAEAVALACLPTGESVVLDGRFRGGWITRGHGRPAEGVHAVQMELAQRFYMDEADPADPADERFERARRALRGAIAAAHAWAIGR